jgi:hypothetical protein
MLCPPLSAVIVVSPSHVFTPSSSLVLDTAILGSACMRASSCLSLCARNVCLRIGEVRETKRDRREREEFRQGSVRDSQDGAAETALVP